VRWGAGLGRVVVAGRSYPIVSISFMGGKLVISAARRGPSPAIHGEPVTVFGADDVGVFQGGDCNFEAAAPGENAPVVLYYTFNKINLPAAL
jgi:hypothetical protein